MSGKQGIILPENGPSCLLGRRKVYQPLVLRASEPEGDIVFLFHKSAVHQDIQQTEHLFCHFTEGSLALRQICFQRITGIAPYVFIRVSFFNFFCQKKKVMLILLCKPEVVSDLKENLVLINAVNPGFILQNFLGLTDKLYHLEILVVFCFSFLQ